MKPGKNFSLQQLSLLAALLTGAGSGLLALLMRAGMTVSVVLFATTCLLGYFLIFYLTDRFVYRKIRLIYKMIQQTKATKKEEFYYKNVLPAKSIEEAEEDVENWSVQYKNEIEILRKNEAFRKEFLQNLSHELRTPIFATQGYIETLIDEAMQDEAVNRKFLQNAGRNIERLVQLVDDLDSISRLESGELPLNRKSFVIQDLIREVFDTMELKAGERNMRCEIKKGCEAPVTVFADREKIRQVLVNLIDNAVKYGNENGLTEAGVYITDGNNVLIEITDSGIGIAEEHLPRIFERFYRTDRARSRSAGGSGLGLAICKHIIEAHGSSIHVRSKVDVGTSFGFTLPNKEII